MQHSSVSPLNTSKSKTLYSFTKQSRFPKASGPQQNIKFLISISCDSVYNIPTSFSKRSTSIGYGKRFGDLIRTTVAPSPQLYNIPSTKDTKQYTFGVSRDKFDNVYIRENPPRDKSVPGPAMYQIKSDYTLTSAAAYSMRPNSHYASMFNDPTVKFPGPGTYDGQAATENKNGYTIYSKFRSPGGAIISKTGERFDLRQHRKSVDIPGPGSYQLTHLGPSMQKNFGAVVFGKSRRLVETKETIKYTPGPGTYRIQSDFGFYNPSDALGSSFSRTQSKMQKTTQ
ncbi:UNKNOWN [Stylonychia lemnae]|uniref:Uncharacterized protein n=1 Tax=Stylonychia lemnae TaxID=5949 RepID=A0A077ZQY6_STYLE|nr:UNKNOWN [Stylonychia lemnae]|eukprot:CDW71854.1 UNKNOWN [Stylonychia lemnae]